MADIQIIIYKSTKCHQISMKWHFTCNGNFITSSEDLSINDLDAFSIAYKIVTLCGRSVFTHRINTYEHNVTHCNKEIIFSM